MVVLQVLGVECRCKGDAREMHLSGCWKAAICHRCHLSQMCSAAREEFPHFLEGLQGAMMAAWEVCLHSEGALFSTMV